MISPINTLKQYTQHSWPSLFIGANRTESSMHVDSGGTNFWMYLLSGQKEWKFFDRSEMIYLYAERWVASNLTKRDESTKDDYLISDADADENVNDMHFSCEK